MEEIIVKIQEEQSELSRYEARSGQSLYVHSNECAITMKTILSPMGLGDVGYATGWLHDLGKMAGQFVQYMEASRQDSKGRNTKRGSVDHSTAGAQWIWRHMGEPRMYKPRSFLRQMMALCVASHHHHSLIDCWRGNLVKDAHFLHRINKADEETHYEEINRLLGDADINFLTKMLQSKSLDKEIRSIHHEIGLLAERNLPECSFLYALVTRCLLSALIEGDYRSASGRGSLDKLAIPDWESLQTRLEQFMSTFRHDGELNRLRASMSQGCLEAGKCKQGLCHLSLPTGAGKTLASLRFALEHAREHSLQRIVYVIPYTTILDQVAASFKDALGKEVYELCVLVHHSNMVMEEKRENGESEPWSDEKKNAYMESCATWDKPIILTTSVQFLHSMYAAGKQYVRRMHSLIRSVIIFDEVQAIPWSSKALFERAICFWTRLGRSTVLFCTATQEKPAASSMLSRIEHQSLLPDAACYFRKFDELRHCTVEPCLKDGSYWTEERLVNLIVSEARNRGTVLAIVNTKPLAAKLAKACKSLLSEGDVWYLSTHLCVAHRAVIIRNHIGKAALADARRRHVPVVCVSTQLIEAGVDVDFDVVVRSVAGLDSCMQAAGRCNRDAKLGRGKVILVNPADTLENISSLEQIRIGREKAMDQLSVSEPNGIFSEKQIQLYYQRINMCYGEKSNYSTNVRGVDTHMIDLLSCNNKLLEGLDKKDKYSCCSLFQAFDSAARNYRAIDEDTVQVITPYGEGRKLAETMRNMTLHTDDDWTRWRVLLAQARQYSINVRSEKCLQTDRFMRIRKEVQIYALADGFYDAFLGCTTECGPLIMDK